VVNMGDNTEVTNRFWIHVKLMVSWWCATHKDNWGAPRGF
jgi:hypothetical protein